MKRTVLIGILAVLLLSGGGLIYLVISNDSVNEGVNTNNPVVDSNKDDDKNVVNLSEEEQELFNQLVKYGKDIYAKETYKTLNKDSNGVYFATLDDLSKLGYDVTVLKTNCRHDRAMIYFDVDHIMFDKYESMEPLQYVINCKPTNNQGKEENQDTTGE